MQRIEFLRTALWARLVRMNTRSLGYRACPDVHLSMALLPETLLYTTAKRYLATDFRERRLTGIDRISPLRLFTESERGS